MEQHSPGRGSPLAGDGTRLYTALCSHTALPSSSHPTPHDSSVEAGTVHAALHTRNLHLAGVGGGAAPKAAQLNGVGGQGGRGRRDPGIQVSRLGGTPGSEMAP